MYSNYNILQTILQCSYPPNFRDYITTVLSELSKMSNTAQFFKVNKSSGYTVDTIIVVKYSIQTTFKGKTFDIPILIYIPKDFPTGAPEIYLEKTNDTGINPKNVDINQQTNRITTTSLKYWSAHTPITTPLTEITTSFNLNFPIYKITPTTSTTTTIGSTSGTVNPYQPQQVSTTTTTQNPTPTGYINPNATTNPLVYTNPNINTNPNPNTGTGYNQSKIPTTTTTTSPYPNATTTIPPTNRPETLSSIEENIKNILIGEIKASVESKIKEESKRLKSQEDKLKNYKMEFVSQNEKYLKYIDNKDNLKNNLTRFISNLQREIEDIKIFIESKENKDLNSQNFEEFITISNIDLIQLVAIEATIEDFLSVIRKAFERGVLNFNECVRFIRFLSREALKIKSYREKISN